MFWFLESSLCWKHLSGCFISRIFSAPCFILQLPYAFSPTVSCRHSHILTSYPHQTPYAVGTLFLYFARWKSRAFSASAQSLSHKTCIFWPYLLCKMRSLFTLLCLFSLLNPPCRPISYMSVSGVFTVPEQSRLANGVKERGEEQRAWELSPASPTSLANILHWSWGWF